MNNNVPNNNGNNDNGLNAVSLGSIEVGGSNPPTPPVESLEQPSASVNPVPTVNPTPVDNLNVTPTVSPVEPAPSVATTTSVPPVVNAEPEVSAANTDVVTPVAPVAPVDPIVEEPTVVNPIPDPVPPVSTVNYDIPQAIDTNMPPIFNEIGTVPPIDGGPIPTPTMNMNNNVPEPTEKKKGKTNKLIFVIIIVLLIAAVGVGVYIFLNMSNDTPVTPTVTLKPVTIEAGSEVSQNIEDYAEFNGIDSSTCTLDTSNITDTTIINNEYSFIITCGEVTYEGSATIVDTTAPQVTLRDVTVQVNNEVGPEDFIVTCDDATKCSYEFVDAEQVNTYIATPADYHVEITVRDEAGNEVIVEGTLIVSQEEVPDVYMSCSMNDENIKLGIVAGEFNGSVVREYSFTLNETDYNAFKEANEDSVSVTYNNVTGVPSFDDENLTVTLSTNLTMEEYEQEAGAVPDTYGEALTYFSSSGYSCRLEQP